jgi:ammonia channel protein AmtB
MVLGKSYEDEIYSTKDAIEIVWTLVSTSMIFFMQAGFALVEVGSVRHKNS